MKKKRLLTIFAVWLLVTLTAAGCGRKQDSTAKQDQLATGSRAVSEPAITPPTKPSTSVIDNRKVIVAFGDSLTQGVAGKSYPAYLQDLLDSRGYSYRIDNQGVSGDTTTDGLARVENVISVKPALVILEFGGNDGLRGIPVKATKDNLEKMIQALTHAHLRIVLAGITLPPNYGPDYVKPFTAMFSSLSKQYRLKLMPFLLVHVYENSALMQPDGIHPNGDGNKVVANDVFDLIRPLLTK